MSLRLLLLSALAVALVVAVGAHRFAPRPSACAAADKADATGLYQQAQTAYATVLAGDPDQRCAQVGMLRAVRERCTTIGILAAEGAGAASQARKAYMSILALDLPVLKDATSAEAARACAEEGMRRHAANVVATPSSTESQ